MSRAVVLFCFLSLAFAKHEVYDGHQVFEVSVSNEDHIKLLRNLELQFGLDVWSEATYTRPGLIMVPGDKSAMFQELLKAEQMEFHLEVENVKTLLDLEDSLFEKAASKSKNRTHSRNSALPLDKIYRYDEVYLKAQRRWTIKVDEKAVDSINQKHFIYDVAVFPETFVAHLFATLIGFDDQE